MSPREVVGRDAGEQGESSEEQRLRLTLREPVGAVQLDFVRAFAVRTRSTEPSVSSPMPSSVVIIGSESNIVTLTSIGW